MSFEITFLSFYVFVLFDKITIIGNSVFYCRLLSGFHKIFSYMIQRINFSLALTISTSRLYLNVT